MTKTAKLVVLLTLTVPLGLGCGDDGGGGDASDGDAEDRIDGDMGADADADIDDDGEACDGCLIDGDCLADGAPNPDNPCEICDPARSVTGWSGDDGEPCDDEIHCNGVDSCGGGTCSVHAGDPCGDDGYFCNGTESCREEADSCDRSGNPCLGATEVCFEDEDACCAPAADRACNLEGDVVSVDSCGHEEEVVETCPDVDHALCVDGFCGCETGFGGADCTGCVVYVSGDDGDDADDGRTWATAKATVQAGLDTAATDGCEVWVAASSDPYLPTLGTGTRYLSFHLRPGVALYGGFAGDESARAQRDPALHETVLSGDLGVAGDNADNACHVVNGADRALIDGFTIRDGQADCLDDGAGTALDWRAVQGAGLWLEGGSLTVGSCLFTGNESRGNGTLYLLTSTVTMTDTTFDGNTVVGGGGAIFVSGAAASMTCADCTFRANTAETGGALYVYEGGRAELADCAIADNQATADGGGFYLSNSSTLTLTDCTVSGNVAGGNGGGGGAITEVYPGATVTALRTVFADNQAGGDGGGFGEPGDWASGQYFFELCLFHGNQAGTNGGGIAMGACAGGSTVRNCDVVGNTAGVEAGGIYSPSEECGPTDGFNSIVWGNSAPDHPDCWDSCESWPNSIVNAETCDVVRCEDPRLVNTDPTLGPLDFHLLPTSPAIDAGRDTEAALADFEGRAWIDDPGVPNCDGTDPTAPDCLWFSDIGAFEYVP